MPLNVEYLFLKRNPFIKLLISFIGSIILSSYLMLNSTVLNILFLISFALILLLFIQDKWIKSYRNNYISGVLIYTSVFLFGLAYNTYFVNFETDAHFSKHANNQSTFKGQCMEIPVEKSRSIQYLIKVDKIVNNNLELEVNGKLIAYFPKKNRAKLPSVGDVFYFKGQVNQIEPPSNPYQFNYKSYLNKKGINHQIFLSLNQINIKNNKLSLYGIAQKTRALFIRNLRKSGLQENELSIVSALLLGDKQSLSLEAKDSYGKAGAMHVLAVSGLHVGIILVILTFVFNFIFGKSKNTIIKTILTVLFIWAFAFVTGLSISVMRSAVMFSFIAVGGVLKHKISIYNTIALSAFVILLINPLFVFDVGFQLSYLAVIGIIILHPKIDNLVYIKNNYLNHAWSITVVSIAAQIATLPISIYYFHQIPVYALLSNLFVIYLATLLLILGIVSILISFIPPLLFLVYWLLHPVIYALNFIVTTVANLPYTTLNHLHISLFEVFLLYSIIIMLYLYFNTKTIRNLNISLTFMAVLLFSDHIENYQLKHKSAIYIYNIKNQLVLNTLSAKTNNLQLSANDSLTIKKLIGQLKNNWSALDVPKTNINYLQKKRNYILQIENTKIAVINVPINPDLPPENVDLVLIGFSANKISNISKKFPSKLFLINNNIWEKERSKLLIEGNKLGLTIYDVKKMGSFKIEL